MSNLDYWSIVAAIYLAPLMPEWFRVGIGLLAGFSVMILGAMELFTSIVGV